MKQKTKNIVVGFAHSEPRFSLFWAIFQYFVRMNAAQMGWSLIDMPASKVDDQVSAIDKLAIQKIDILLVKPATSGHDGLIAAINKTIQAGIPVVLLDGAVGGDMLVPIVRPDDFGGQAALADHIFERMNGAGKVAHLQGYSGFESAMRRCEGLHSILPKYPGIELISQTSTDWASPLTQRETGSLLARESLDKHPDLKAIFAANDEAALGIIDVVSELDLADQVLIAGFDALPQALVAIQDGKMEATVSQNADELSKQALAAGLAKLQGKSVDAEIIVGTGLITKEKLTDAALQTMRVFPEIMRELSHRSQHSTENESTSSFLEIMIDNVPTMLFVKEAEHLRLVRCNKAREEWLGIKKEDQIGKNAYDFYPKELAEKFEESDRALLAGGKMVDIPEEEAMTARGLRYVHTRKIPIFDPNGKPAYLLGISMDVTERKQTREALAQRNTELELAHTALKENQVKLLISEKMASLGRLTAGIAHEMNTPLAAVRTAMSELLKLTDEYEQAIDDPEVNGNDHREIAAEMKNAIHIANKSAERAAGFVRGVKSQTRDLSAQQGVTFNAVPVVRECLLLLSHALRDSQCSSSFKSSDEFIALFGSPGRLAQVVTNLITNAIDASHNRTGATVDLTLSVVGNFMELRVQDNGCGIAPENITKIFDPMFTTKPFGQGTGLGLTIVHDIVSHDFDGTIEIDSKPGKGATFLLRFAIDKESEN